MNARDYWDTYVEKQGGPAALSDKSGLPYSTIAGVCNGSRGIGRDLAEKLVAFDPLLDAGKLLWVRAYKRPADHDRAA